MSTIGRLNNSENFWMTMSIGLSLLNMFDAVATLYLLQTGMIYEANPIMRYLIDISPLVFISVKTLISIAILFIGMHWNKQLFNVVRTSTCIFICTLFYTGIAINHIIIWSII